AAFAVLAVAAAAARRTRRRSCSSCPTSRPGRAPGTRSAFPASRRSPAADAPARPADREEGRRRLVPGGRELHAARVHLLRHEPLRGSDRQGARNRGAEEVRREAGEARRLTRPVAYAPPMAAPVQRDEELELHVDSLAYGGNGVARLDGFVVFVKAGLPGDTVRARVTKVQRRHAEAITTEVLEAGPQ